MSIEDRVIKIINENIEEKGLHIDINTSLKEDLGLDSLNLIMILNALEDEFEITLNEEEVFKSDTIGDVIKRLMEATEGL